MEIVQIPISEVIPYARNPRKNLDAVDKVAASIQEFGFKQPIVVDSEKIIVAGHTRYLAAKKLNLENVPVVIAKDLSPTKIKAYRLADNRVSQESSWDTDLLSLELEDLKSLEYDLALTGFDEDEIDDIFNEDEQQGLTEDDDIPDVSEKPVSVRGDVWSLGNHRLMCGDSTVMTDVEKLMDGKKSSLLHADPPYGMKKEKDGVENDNLGGEKLDNFQMEWWATFRAFIYDNASAYIWGNAPELWRLWYVGGLEKTKELRLINEIVWAKVHSVVSEKYSALGQSSKDMRQYPTCSERCLFLMLGECDFNNNSDNYFEGWEAIRSYLEDEVKKSGLKVKDIKNITKSHMHKHWMTKSQWSFIDELNYNKLHEATNKQFFKKPYVELKKEYLVQKKVFNGKVMHDFYSGRAYFDNSHDKMADVWNFERVKDEERWGHATPKPVAMMERILKSSSKKNDIVIEPFAGSGSTLIACEKLGRFCYTMEISEKYCDVVINRWQEFSGKKAVHEELSLTFDEIKNQREKSHEEEKI